MLLTNEIISMKKEIWLETLDESDDIPVEELKPKV